MELGKKEVKLFGVLHNEAGLTAIINELKPQMKKGRSIALELTPDMTDFFEGLLKAKLTEEKLREAMKAKLKADVGEIYGGKKEALLSKEGKYEVANFRSWFEIFKLARESGMKVVPMDSKALHSKTLRMLIEQEKIEMPFREREGLSRGLENFSMQLDKDIERVRGTSFYRKYQQTMIAGREANFGKVIEKKRPDLVICGTEHLPGLKRLRLKRIKWQTASELLVLRPVSRLAFNPREHYRQRIKAAKKRLDSLPRTKRRKKKKSIRSINKLARMHRV